MNAKQLKTLLWEEGEAILYQNGRYIIASENEPDDPGYSLRQGDEMMPPDRYLGFDTFDELVAAMELQAPLSEWQESEVEDIDS